MLSPVGRDLLRASSLGHWVALLISGSPLSEQDLTLTPWAGGTLYKRSCKMTCSHS